MLSKDNLIFLILFQIRKKKKEVNQMNTVIKGTKSITEFKRKKSELTSMAEKHGTANTRGRYLSNIGMDQYFVTRKLFLRREKKCKTS